MSNKQWPKSRPGWKRPKPRQVRGLSRRESNVIYDLLLDRCCEDRDLNGGNTWRIRWMENLAQRVGKATPA